MKAIYQAADNPLYKNNPFVEALPPMLTGRSLISRLSSFPAYSDEDRDKSPGIRIQLLSNLYEFYQPLPMTVELYTQIYTSMQMGFGRQCGVEGRKALIDGYKSMIGNETSFSAGGGDSFAFVGASGLGKSTALNHVLSLFPKVIEHEEYNGDKMFCKQIPYIMVQTPHDCSVKSMCLDILVKIDELIGSEYSLPFMQPYRFSTDVLLNRIAQISRCHHLGVLIVDEVQNLVYGNGALGIRLLNFLVQLVNSCSMCVCLVGTPRIYELLNKEFRAARRATGLVYERLENGPEFRILINGLWHYQYTRYTSELTPEIQQWLYRKSRGIPDILVKIIYQSQKTAILSGREKIDVSALETAYRKNFAFLSGFLEELDSKNSAGKEANDIDYRCTETLHAEKKIKISHDLRTLSNRAKRQGRRGDYGLVEYIKGEVEIC